MSADETNPSVSHDGSRELRVLVADDWQDTAESTALLLRLYGYQAEIACNGQAALEKASAYRPDVILLDIMLPGVEGYQIAKQLKEACRWKRPFIIAATGLDTAVGRPYTTESGIDLHLPKPVDPDLLRSLLKRFQRILA